MHRLPQRLNKSHPLDNVVENTRAGAASVALIIHTANSEARITPRENLGFSGCRMARYLVKRVEFDVYEICAMNLIESAAPRSQEPISSIDRTAFVETSIPVRYAPLFRIFSLYEYLYLSVYENHGFFILDILVRKLKLSVL